VFGPEPVVGQRRPLRRTRSPAPVAVLPRRQVPRRRYANPRLQQSPTSEGDHVTPPGFGQGGSLDTSFRRRPGVVQPTPGREPDRSTRWPVLRDGEILAGAAPSETPPDVFRNDFILAPLQHRRRRPGTDRSGTGGIATTVTSPTSVRREIRSAPCLVPANARCGVVRPSRKEPEEAPRHGNGPYNDQKTGRWESFSGDGKLRFRVIASAAALAAAAAPDGRQWSVGRRGPPPLCPVRRRRRCTAPVSGSASTGRQRQDRRPQQRASRCSPAGRRSSTRTTRLLHPREKDCDEQQRRGVQAPGLSPAPIASARSRLTGWNRTQPAGAHPLGYYDVTVDSGRPCFGQDFGIARPDRSLG